MDQQASTDPAAWVAQLQATNADAVRNVKTYLRERVTEAPTEWRVVLKLLIDIREQADQNALTVEWVKQRWTEVEDGRVVQLAVLAHAMVAESWMPATTLWDISHAWSPGQAATVVESIHITRHAPDDNTDLVEAELRHCRRGDIVALAMMGATGLSALDFPITEMASLFNLATAIQVDS